MESARFRRERSTIEVLGLLVAAIVGIGVALTLHDSLASLGQMPPDSWWADLLRTWRRRSVGVAPLVLIAFFAHRWLPERPLLRWPALAALTMLAAAAGWHSHNAWIILNGGRGIKSGFGLTQLHTYFVVAALLVGLREFQVRSQRAAQALHESRLSSIRLHGELAAGRLQVLQAQIEPHFLFNSLANVRRLLRIDGPAGRAMIGDLLSYLEIALPRIRASESTLAREAELVRAFLAVHQVRMAQRLQVRFDVPDALGVQPVPPMMLLTLVENALKHGLNPLPEGGAITVAATGQDGVLTLSVADTGRGIVAGTGNGTGLANIRARLKAMYGAAASLSLRVNEPRGVIASIELPEQAA